eukprot:611297-Rhodomonas_salina.3
MTNVEWTYCAQKGCTLDMASGSLLSATSHWQWQISLSVLTVTDHYSPYSLHSFLPLLCSQIDASP